MTRFAPLWDQDAEYSASVDRRLLAALWPEVGVSGGVVSAQGGGMIINVAPVAAAIPAPNGTGTVLCVSDAVEQLLLDNAGGGGQHRYDTLVVEPHGADIGGSGEAEWIIRVLSSASGASPTPPAVPAGCAGLAQVYIAGGSVTINPTNITDLRPPRQLAVGDPRIPHTSGLFNAGATLSWIQNGWANWPPGNPPAAMQIPFTKYRADTVLKVFCSTTCYIGPTAPGVAQIGFRIGTGADTSADKLWIVTSAAQPRATLVGQRVVSGLAAGPLTVNMRANWPYSDASNSLNFGPNKFATMTVTEDYA